MLGNDTYKEFARWREHWMSIMSPKSVSFELSAFKPDARTAFASNESHLLHQASALTRVGSSQEPGLTETTITNEVCSEPEKTELDAYIWED